MNDRLKRRVKKEMARDEFRKKLKLAAKMGLNYYAIYYDYSSYGSYMFNSEHRCIHDISKEMLDKVYKKRIVNTLGDKLYRVWEGSPTDALRDWELSFEFEHRDYFNNEYVIGSYTLAELITEDINNCIKCISK